MRLKLDENMDIRLAALLRQAGHDTTTVRVEGLRGTADPALYEHCILKAVPSSPSIWTSQISCVTRPSVPQVSWFSAAQTISFPQCGS